jgi:uncharacterized membrane protein
MCAIRHAPCFIVWDRALPLARRRDFAAACAIQTSQFLLRRSSSVWRPVGFPNLLPPLGRALLIKGAIMFESNPYGISDNVAGGLAYITIIPAILFLIVEPFKKISFVRFNAWQSIFFYIAWAVVHILVEVAQNLVPTVLFLTLSLWQFVDLAFFVILIIVFVNAFNGKRILLPIVGGLAERQANR